MLIATITTINGDMNAAVRFTVDVRTTARVTDIVALAASALPGAQASPQGDKRLFPPPAPRARGKGEGSNLKCHQEPVISAPVTTGGTDTTATGSTAAPESSSTAGSRKQDDGI